MAPATKATPGNPEILVTPTEIIVIEARPLVSADEIAYYGSSGRGGAIRGFIFGGIAIALGVLSALVILTGVAQAVHDLFVRGLP